MMKKNPVFSFLIILCLLAFGAGAYLTYAEFSKSSKGEKALKSAKQDLEYAQNGTPAPSDANVKAAEDNVAELEVSLGAIYKDLQRSARLSVSTDGVRLVADILGFIQGYQRRFAVTEYQWVDPQSLDVVQRKVQVPEGFGFGFDRFKDQASLPEDPEKIKALGKQYQILEYILDTILASGLHGINAVERELIELDEQQRTSGFSIDQSISAREPGVVDTMAFSVTFSGSTKSLRYVLNEFSSFQMPIVVRSIEVVRPKGSETIRVDESAGDGFDAIFANAFGEATPEEDEPVTEVQQPLVTDTDSQFTLVLEFIEIVLSEESSDAAQKGDAS